LNYFGNQKLLIGKRLRDKELFLPIPNSQFPIPNSQFLVPNSQFHALHHISLASSATVIPAGNSEKYFDHREQKDQIIYCIA
jgi:hypothetical protein